MFTEKEIFELTNQATDLAFKMLQEKNYQNAELILQQTLKVYQSINVFQLMGLTKYYLEKYEEGIEYFKEAIILSSNDSENYNNIALCYSNLGQYDMAIGALLEALTLKPNSTFILNNLGLQYRHKQDIDNAITQFQKSLEIDNNNETTWGMLGGCFGEEKKLDKAEECFTKALEINPNFAEAHVDLAHIYHLKGEWEKSWPEYAWRGEIYNQLKFWQKLYLPEKKWAGQSLINKTIIVHTEQGLGDAIHFFRYIPFLNGKVIIHCAATLALLFKKYETYTVDPTTCKLEDIPNHDYHCSIMDLPLFLNIPIPQDPYLKTDKGINIDNYPEFKIGIVWGGNPQHPNDRYRSCALSLFKHIADIPDVKLFSLMKDIRPRIYRFEKNSVDLTAGTENMKLVDMSSIMNNFEDTAAIINSLDLIITVDTAILHLAGAMGKPTWGLISWNCDWRWEIDGERTIWYPTVKLFRQQTKNDWTHVFLKIESEIKKWMQI